MLEQSIGIALITLLAYSHPVFGYSQLDRPIITGVLVGLVMGNVTLGAQIGASLELIYIGSAAVGGALPPDYCSGGILATAFAIASGSGIEGAVALSLPIATLVSLVKNFLYTVARGWCLHKGDDYAKEGNLKGIEAMHWLSAYIAWGVLALITGFGFFYGNDAVSSILAIIPSWLTRGISAAAGMLPALGLALLAKFLNNKLLLPFFFIGFLTVALFKTSILGISCLALCIALLIVANNKESNALKEGGNDDDF